MANSYEEYQKQLANIYEQIQNREPFQYDMNADPLYQQYKDQYVQGGKLAMKDTMGQAAGLTGGYGSTYGQQVGQQAYNSYLQNLGAQLPQLYEMAYGMYRDRGDDLLKQYNFLKANPVEAPVPAESGSGGSGGGGGGGGGPRGGGGNGSQLGLGAVAGAAGGLTAGLYAALGGIKPQTPAAPEYQTRGQVIRGAQQALDNGSITYQQYKDIMSQFDYKAPSKKSKERGGTQR